jgi:hypothetical protein
VDGIEQIVHLENVSLHSRLGRLGIPHVWDDYGPGFHRWPYWNRDLRESLPSIMATFRRRPRPPSPFTFTAIEPAYEIYGWNVSLERRALEFSVLRRARRSGFALSGSGRAVVTTPPVYRAAHSYRVVLQGRFGTIRLKLRARRGRLRIPVRLGPSNSTQEQFTADGKPIATKIFTTAVTIALSGR